MFQHCQMDMHWLGSVSIYEPYGEHSDVILWLYCTTILVLLVLKRLNIQQGMGASIHSTLDSNKFTHLSRLLEPYLISSFFPINQVSKKSEAKAISILSTLSITTAIDINFLVQTGASTKTYLEWNINFGLNNVVTFPQVIVTCDRGLRIARLFYGDSLLIRILWTFIQDINHPLTILIA